MTATDELFRRIVARFSSHEGEGVLLRVDDVSVFASVSGFFLFAGQLWILGVLGARWIRVVAAAQQGEAAGSLTGSLQEAQIKAHQLVSGAKDIQIRQIYKRN